MRAATVNDALTVGEGSALVLISGPCLIEDADLMLEVARSLSEIAHSRGLGFVFKSSFDKANRSSGGSPRGPGFEAGLEILAHVKNELQVAVTTDIHEPWQAQGAAEVVDILQVPALLCRQTDLLRAAAETGRVVNVKKGQFMAPWEMGNVVTKLEKAGAHGILLTERGSSFGYNNLVVDFRSLPQLRSLGHPVVFDASHSVQLPGARGASSGGQKEFVGPLARAAVAVGVDALFVESHPNPDAAPSDGPNMLTPDAVALLLDELLSISSAAALRPQ